MATLNSNACTDADEVRDIIDTDLEDSQINAFINMAYFLTRVIAGKLTDCGGSDAECEIQKLLAAHFITIRERQTKNESIGGEWSVGYMGQDGLGLDASLYGQQAQAMDCSGELARAGLKRPRLEVISYEDLEEQEPPDSYLD